MAHTVQSFVDTLREDGVEAGRLEGEKIRNEASQMAKQIISDAEDEARKIVEEAERHSERISQRTRTELELAARDTLSRLRDALSQAIDRLLAEASSKTLDDAKFLKDLIHEIVLAYAQADASGDQMIEFNVSKPMQQKLTDWAIAWFHQADGHPELPVEIHGALVSAGFEYKIGRGTVEVTPESVVELLSQVVTPQLNEVLITIQEEQGTEG